MAKSITRRTVQRGAILRNQPVRARELRQMNENLGEVFAYHTGRNAGVCVRNPDLTGVNTSTHWIPSAGGNTPVGWSEYLVFEHCTASQETEIKIWVLGQDCRLYFSLSDSTVIQVDCGTSFGWYSATESNVDFTDGRTIITFDSSIANGTKPQFVAFFAVETLLSASDIR